MNNQMILTFTVYCHQKKKHFLMNLWKLFLQLLLALVELMNLQL